MSNNSPGSVAASFMLQYYRTPVALTSEPERLRITWKSGVRDFRFSLTEDMLSGLAAWSPVPMKPVRSGKLNLETPRSFWGGSPVAHVIQVVELMITESRAMFGQLLKEAGDMGLLTQKGLQLVHTDVTRGVLTVSSIKPYVNVSKLLAWRGPV